MSVKKEEKVDFVKWFSELNKSSGQVAGGKGSNLAEIYNLKVNVPPGFVITAQAYDYFIEKAGLKEKIENLLKQIEYENTKDLDEKTKKIRDLIIAAEIPKDMQEEILESYELLDTNSLKNVKGTVLEILKSSEPIFVAVRSSATTEDLADASFAGQQESFTNIKGKIELLTNVKKCMASLFTPRATYYRHKKGYEHTKASLAVVIQKMVDSDKSGVIFSRDPTNNTEEIILEAVFGLGEGIVSGSITPDKYVISRDLERH
jgi:pyruvate,water dikinase